MAVLLKIPSDKILLALEVPQDHVMQLKALGIEAVLTPSKIALCKAGEVLTSVAVNHQNAMKLVKGEAVDPAVAMSVKTGLQVAVASLVSGVDAPASALEALKAKTGSTSAPELKTKSKPAVLFKPEPITDTPSAQLLSGVKSPPPEGGWPMFELSKLVSAPPVKLRDADKLYQPVHGSSAGSRYFLIAGNDELRVAARYTGSTLSLRVEGSKIADHMQGLYDNGFPKAIGKDYTSIHVECPTPAHARWVVGQVLLGLGVHWRTAMPDIGVLHNKGA